MLFAKRLPNVDSVRAIAVLLILFAHIEEAKRFSSIYNIRAIVRIYGYLSVSIFFVLSGFLLTYLLLYEYITKGTISVKKFYIRRALRIWPLYFLVLFFGAFIYPSNIGIKGLLLSVFFCLI